MANGISKMALKGIVSSFLLCLQLTAQGDPYEFNQIAYTTPCDLDCSHRFWADAEYLFWGIRNSPNPVPLLVTGPTPNPVFNDPTTGTVLGRKSIRNDWRSGARFTVGYWFDDESCYGLDANYFFLPKGSTHQEVHSDATIFLSVPFFNTLLDEEDSSPVSVPGRFKGYVDLNTTNSMQSAEINGLITINSDAKYNIRGIGGFRYWNFQNSLTFLVDSPAIATPAEVYLVRDHFETINNFYGPQIGLAVDHFYCDFFFNLQGKVALGAMCQELEIDGEFITNDFNGFGTPESFVGGYFALPSNIGSHTRTCFAAVSEFNFNMGYQIFNCLMIKVGYNALFANEVLWAGKQIDRNINPSQSALYEFTATPVLVGEAVPKPSFHNECFWTHGVSVGLEFQF